VFPVGPGCARTTIEGGSANYSLDFAAVIGVRIHTFYLQPQHRSIPARAPEPRRRGRVPCNFCLMADSGQAPPALPFRGSTGSLQQPPHLRDLVAPLQNADGVGSRFFQYGRNRSSRSPLSFCRCPLPPHPGAVRHFCAPLFHCSRPCCNYSCRSATYSLQTLLADPTAPPLTDPPDQATT